MAAWRATLTPMGARPSRLRRNGQEGGPSTPSSRASVGAFTTPRTISVFLYRAPRESFRKALRASRTDDRRLQHGAGPCGDGFASAP